MSNHNSGFRRAETALALAGYHSGTIRDKKDDSSIIACNCCGTGIFNPKTQINPIQVLPDTAARLLSMLSIYALSWKTVSDFNRRNTTKQLVHRGCLLFRSLEKTAIV